MIKLACFDFDGVFTDGQIYFNNDNEISKSYNVKDGMGIKLLQKKGIQIGILSNWPNNIATKKICDHLEISFMKIGKFNKIDVLNKWIKEMDIDMNSVSYMGDDINDIQILKSVKYSACPNDAHPSIIKYCKYKTKNYGGKGAVREFCDILLSLV